MNPIDPNVERLEAGRLSSFANTKRKPGGYPVDVIKSFRAWIKTQKGTFPITAERYGSDQFRHDLYFAVALAS
jgi:hypothetical protein